MNFILKYEILFSILVICLLISVLFLQYLYLLHQYEHDENMSNYGIQVPPQ